MQEISQAQQNMLNLFSHNPNLSNDLAMVRAIMSDVVEINLGLDYGATTNKSDEELYGLYCLLSIMPKQSDSAKSILLNKVKAMSESQAKNILNNE